MIRLMFHEGHLIDHNYFNVSVQKVLMFPFLDHMQTSKLGVTTRTKTYIHVYY